ncbi:MAG: hypothetical protein U0903_16105 [Planctomycetales bacterium]
MTAVVAAARVDGHDVCLAEKPAYDQDLEQAVAGEVTDGALQERREEKWVEKTLMVSHNQSGAGRRDILQATDDGP